MNLGQKIIRAQAREDHALLNKHHPKIKLLESAKLRIPPGLHVDLSIQIQPAARDIAAFIKFGTNLISQVYSKALKLVFMPIPNLSTGRNPIFSLDQPFGECGYEREIRSGSSFVPLTLRIYGGG
jgi:hypothetical protein